MARQTWLGKVLRTRVRECVNTAFPGLTVISGRRPRLLLQKANLPRAFVYLGRNTRGRNEDTGARAVKDISDHYTFEISYQEVAPDDVPIEERKDDICEALIGELTDEMRFAGIGIYRNIADVDFREERDNPATRIHEVTLMFEVTTLQHY